MGAETLGNSLAIGSDTSKYHAHLLSRSILSLLLDPFKEAMSERSVRLYPSMLMQNVYECLLVALFTVIVLYTFPSRPKKSYPSLPLYA